MQECPVVMYMPGTYVTPFFKYQSLPVCGCFVTAGLILRCQVRALALKPFVITPRTTCPACGRKLNRLPTPHSPLSGASSALALGQETMPEKLYKPEPERIFYLTREIPAVVVQAKTTYICYRSFKRFCSLYIYCL